jgi:hypothetical protein
MPHPCAAGGAETERGEDEAFHDATLA